MTDISKLPPTLADLFQPRPPLKYAKPLDYDPSERRTHHISGVSQYLEIFNRPDPDYRPTETWLQQKAREKRVKQEAHEASLKEAIEKWNPANDPQVRGDPYKTLFISRLSYEVNEQDLEKEFVRFGPIERVRVVRDNETGKSSGYAFIVFERERDLKAAYKETNGLVIKGRKVLVDVERGRTVKDWKPRKLGGGLGGRHYTKNDLLRSRDALRNSRLLPGQSSTVPHSYRGSGGPSTREYSDRSPGSTFRGSAGTPRYGTSSSRPESSYRDGRPSYGGDRDRERYGSRDGDRYRERPSSHNYEPRRYDDRESRRYEDRDSSSSRDYKSGRTDDRDSDRRSERRGDSDRGGERRDYRDRDYYDERRARERKDYDIHSSY